MRASKMYLHQVQLFGGKMALLFEDISQWLGHLWHGKQLAITVGWLSVAVAAALFLIAHAVDRRDER